MSDAKNLGILPFILFFVLGNLSYLGKRFKWGESKEETPAAKPEVKS